jgi:hypothetical protein
MSSGLECHFIEPVKGKWYYILQDGGCPRDCWDWRETANCYGSFISLEAATKHLFDNHQNPGGWNEIPFEEFKDDEVYAKLVKEAKTNHSRHIHRASWLRY